jgi:hypothetical protein
MSQVNGSEESKEICGHLGHHTSTQVPRRPSFVDKSGWIEVDYVLQEERRDSLPLDDANITNFNISFTPFTECPEEAFPFGNEELRPCSLLDTFSCIPSDYFCDGVVNCGFPHEFGLDEANCPLLTIKDEVEDEDYVILEDDHIKNATPSKAYIQFMVWRSSNQMNWGMFSSLTILILLYSLVKSKRSGGGGRSSLVIERLDVNTKSDGSSYQAESLEAEEPAPSYLECLLDTPPVYSELSYEYERPPPTYEQIKVHKNHSKL